MQDSNGLPLQVIFEPLRHARESGKGSKVQTFSWRVVVCLDEFDEAIVGKGGQVSFSGKGSAHAADCIFDSVFLPRRICVTEEGLDIECMRFVVARELGAIVEGDCLAPLRWQRCEDVGHSFSDRFRGLAG